MSGEAGALDPLIHAPARLRLCALLCAVTEAEFSVLRDELALSDSVLSKHVGALAEAGYVRSRKASREGRRTTWLSITGKGAKAFRGHVAALQALAAPPA